MKAQITLILSTYRSEQYIPAWLESIKQQTAWEKLKLVIVANEPSAAERKLLQDFKTSHAQQCNLMIVPRESLYASWNRALFAVDTPYVGIANVDDLREPESIERQLAAITKSKALFCYGAFTIVKKFGSTSGTIIPAREFDKELFTTGMQIGPFFIWKHDPAQLLFDEQFRSGGDFDFAIRLALAGKGVPVHESLGYYLHAGSGLSTGNDLQSIEHNVVVLRYGLPSPIRHLYLRELMNYAMPAAKIKGEWIALPTICPQYKGFAAEQSARFKTSTAHKARAAIRAIKRIKNSFF